MQDVYLDVCNPGMVSNHFKNSVTHTGEFRISRPIGKLLGEKRAHSRPEQMCFFSEEAGRSTLKINDALDDSDSNAGPSSAHSHSYKIG